MDESLVFRKACGPHPEWLLSHGGNLPCAKGKAPIFTCAEDGSLTACPKSYFPRIIQKDFVGQRTIMDESVSPGVT